MKKKFEVINREISWLSFNDRVLQEAQDKGVPLIERLRFLGIFSNNRDEFFRVRVATLRRLEALKLQGKIDMSFDPSEILKEIQEVVLRQQKKFESYYHKIVEQMRDKGIHFVNEKELTIGQEEFVRTYFDERVRTHLVPLILDEKYKFPQIKDSAVFLCVKIPKKKKLEGDRYAIIEIPAGLDRFLVLPGGEGKDYVMLLDDVIRLNLKELFPIFHLEQKGAYTFKITRDSELDIDDDDISTGLIEKMERSIENRKKGELVRFIHDVRMPDEMLGFLFKKLKLKPGENIIPGGRYHNFKDFIGFPDLGDRKLINKQLQPLGHRYLKTGKSLISSLDQKDMMLVYPYQSFDYVIDLLREAAIDPFVTHIKINIYRVAKNSKIINALVNAARNGKKVTAVIELKARFDEQNNIDVSNELQAAGVKVDFGIEGLKIHSKMFLISRREDKVTRHYAHIGTGNFHEGTAKIYSDISLLTADERITKEVVKTFNFFENPFQRNVFRHLVVSPFGTRRKYSSLIDTEIKNAKKGKKAYMVLKLNNLVDNGMIKKLYEASHAGVKITLIIRGICSLVPGVKGMSENIKVISIIDRFLEHARIFMFANGGEELYYLTSSDWMHRNLEKRVEVSAPVYDKRLQRMLKRILDYQMRDNVKARLIDRDLSNHYKPRHNKEPFRSQMELYQHFKNKGEIK